MSSSLSFFSSSFLLLLLYIRFCCEYSNEKHFTWSRNSSNHNQSEAIIITKNNKQDIRRRILNIYTTNLKSFIIKRFQLQLQDTTFNQIIPFFWISTHNQETQWFRFPKVLIWHVSHCPGGKMRIDICIQDDQDHFILAKTEQLSLIMWCKGWWDSWFVECSK
jgi:hypothetical protein